MDMGVWRDYLQLLDQVGETMERLTVYSQSSAGCTRGYCALPRTRTGTPRTASAAVLPRPWFATQLRDPYLDIRYRNENSKLGANDEKLNSLYQIGNILDEVGKGKPPGAPS